MAIQTKHTGKISYRKAKDSDRDDIITFTLEALNDPVLPQFAIDIGEDLLNRVRMGKDFTLYIAVNQDEEDKVVGYIELKTFTENHHNYHVIEGIYVLPDYRGYGIGQKLVDTAYEEFCEEGDILKVITQRKEDLSFWKINGFVINSYELIKQK